jgi:hypothetical protein
VRAPEEARCDHTNPVIGKRFLDEVPRGGVFGMKRTAVSPAALSPRPHAPRACVHIPPYT